MRLVKNNAKPKPEIRNPTAGGHHLQKLISATRAAELRENLNSDLKHKI